MISCRFQIKQIQSILDKVFCNFPSLEFRVNKMNASCKIREASIFYFKICVQEKIWGTY